MTPEWNALICKFPKLLITDPDTIYYLTGCCTPGGSFAALVHSHPTTSLIVRDLESSNYTSMNDTAEMVQYSEEDPIALVARALGDGDDLQHFEIGFEAQSCRMTPLDGKTLMQKLPNSTFTDVSNEMKWMRATKTPDEVQCIRVAASHVTAAFEYALPHVRVGMTETELSGLFTLGKMRHGSEWTAYPEFVAFGANGCIGHHPASPSKTLQENEIVFLEIGACHKRYHASKMHAFYVGTPPPWFHRLEHCIRKAMRVAVSVCKPGICAKVVDKAMRDIITNAFSECDIVCPHAFRMLRRSGYSIGIGNATDWSDGVGRITPSSTDVLTVGMVLHLIPWIHVNGVGAMGFSDIVEVKADGLVSLFEEAL